MAAAKLRTLNQGVQPTKVGPYLNATVVSPSDTVDLTYVAYNLVCNFSGTVTVDTYGGQTNIPIAVIAGMPLELLVTRVYATGTDSGTIIALD